MLPVTLEDWLDDLCVRFILNVPIEELSTVERICFLIEEAHWFYEDFARPRNSSLPSFSDRSFSLLLFEHCPLFAQWNRKHYEDAFVEWMTYKQRIPVRGVIMLNDRMDEIVLVKGYKKGASWSFPRGKINLQESDLDCAIREAWEETGFDLNEAGLVPEDRNVHSVSQTMKGQHLMFFVFRGVSKDTVFVPQTRKEISRVEWFKLEDLPTYGKKGKGRADEAANGEHDAQQTAIRYYMVAPFLGPLKKWISQQKKMKNRHSSNLAVAPMVASESELEASPGRPQSQRPLTGTDLAEVDSGLQQPGSSTAFGGSYIDQSEPVAAHMPQVDVGKSNALLSLLRNGPPAEMRASPQTPLERQAFPASSATQIPRGGQQNTGLPMSPPPHLQMQPQVSFGAPPDSSDAQTAFRKPDPFSNPSFSAISRQPAPRPQTAFPNQGHAHPQSSALPRADFAPSREASLLTDSKPLLDNHRQSLLGAFRSPSLSTPIISPPLPTMPGSSSHQQALLNAFKSPIGAASPPLPTMPGSNPQQQSLLNAFRSPNFDAPPQQVVTGPDAKPDTHRDSLLAAFRRPSMSPSAAAQTARSPPKPASTDLLSQLLPGSKTVDPSLPTKAAPMTYAQMAAPNGINGHQPKAAVPIQRKIDQPVELSTGPVEHKPFVSPGQRVREPATKTSIPTLKEGETSAIVGGPLDQPDFDAVSRNKQREVGSNELGRSPLTSHRKLFDPKEQAQQPVKILARPKTPKGSKTQTQSQQGANVRMASPRRTPKTSKKEKEKEPVKAPFQPTILRRPKEDENVTPVPVEKALFDTPRKDLAVEEEKETAMSVPSLPPQPVETEQHKKALLQLFGGGSASSSILPPRGPSAQSSRVVSPLSTSQVLSPKEDVPISAVDPISTRSRMSSMISVEGAASGSGIAMAASGQQGYQQQQKRTTAPENKSFLLNYLGRMASGSGP
ncbi:mRNA decapping complex subunit 2 [Cyphellophora attinorum]|uniref:mRNA decapping complex subunit 2 n=1 Tax=Cyphellophora attinorum TaxID=1664694 RepID=A0A0N1NZV6_9EURO|nr:mRNA decapping complex subunit 2 [Phialophora attinorum]KPI38967.1 mRNA decapping complex subunit 2 [Phialophora attinorum]